MQVTIKESYTQPSALAEIICGTCTLSIGDSMTIDMGYTDNHVVMLIGTVKSIIMERPERIYRVAVYDALVKASDYFLASDDPTAPFSRENIQAETLVQDLLAEAGLTSVSLDSPGFTFGLTGPVEFNLETVWDAVRQIAEIVGYHVYAQTDGTIRFTSRPPYITGGDVSEHTFSTGPTGDLKTVYYERSTVDLRNRVVVYGKDPFKATASDTSPYLPADFYQSAVIAHEMIDTQQGCDDSAALNLIMLNRLTESFRLVGLGDPTIRIRDIVTVSETFTGVSGLWFVYETSHRLDKTGYSMDLTLTK